MANNTAPQDVPNELLGAAVAQQFIEQTEAERILEEARRSDRDPEAILWGLPNIDTTKLLALKSTLTGIPTFALEPGATIPLEVLELVPEEAATRYQAVPLRVVEGMLEVGMLRPEDVATEEAFRFLAQRRNFKIRKFLISPKDFQEILRQYKDLHEEVTEALGGFEKALEEAAAGQAPGGARQRLVEDAPLTKTVAVILKYATEGRASDIHIEPLEKNTRIRFRLDGMLHTSLYVPRDVHSGIVARIKVLADMKIDEKRIPQDGRFRAKVEGRSIDFRVSTFPSADGEKVVMRILDPTIGLEHLENLGLVGHSRDVLERAMARPFGMILISGPTGSGKSTTLNGMIRILNKEDVNIVTLEDPVEYYVEGVSQSEIRPEIGYTFATGLRHILRQDPDIILVGEIRDTETALLGVHASLTGHLLLSSLHTNNSAGVIPRLIDMKVEPFLIPATLAVAVAQRLIKRLCPYCKVEETLPGDMQKVADEVLEGLPESEKPRLAQIKERKFYRPVGCKLCSMKGSKGRVAVYEVLEMTPQLEAITIREPSEHAIAEEIKRQGMVSMKQDGVLKALEGLVSLQEVLESVI